MPTHLKNRLSANKLCVDEIIIKGILAVNLFAKNFLAYNVYLFVCPFFMLTRTMPVVFRLPLIPRPTHVPM